MPGQAPHRDRPIVLFCFPFAPSSSDIISSSVSSETGTDRLTFQPQRDCCSKSSFWNSPLHFLVSSREVTVALLLIEQPIQLAEQGENAVSQQPRIGCYQAPLPGGRNEEAQKGGDPRGPGREGSRKRGRVEIRSNNGYVPGLSGKNIHVLFTVGRFCLELHSGKVLCTKNCF